MPEIAPRSGATRFFRPAPAPRVWVPLLCVFAATLEAQQYSSPDTPQGLLLQVRKKLMLTIERLPRYMCTETIDRSTFALRESLVRPSCDDLASRRKESGWRVRKRTSDRLRLDLGVTGDSEVYSWVGENRFRDRSLADLVQGGATWTGAFGSLLRSIFGSTAAAFTYNGDVKVDGRVFCEFGFRVPLETSGYSISDKQLRAIVAYDGTFLVDPKNFDLVRLTVHADQIPAELGRTQYLRRHHDCRVRYGAPESFRVSSSEGRTLACSSR
jgi:hypothetical protein